jgi:hypothetical protein
MLPEAYKEHKVPWDKNVWIQFSPFIEDSQPNHHIEGFHLPLLFHPVSGTSKCSSLL